MSEEQRLTELSFLRGITGGQNDKIAKYIRMFLTGAPQNITQMELYALSKDWAGLKTTAHSLKPQLGFFGAKPTEELLKQIEHHAGAQTETDKLPAMIEQFRLQFEKISVELEKDLGTLS